MARPIKTGLDYFPHDTDASSDEKLQSLRALYRNDGYAFYFITLERIYRTSNGELDLSSEQEKRILAKKIGISLKKLDTILKSCFKMNLFSFSRFSKDGVLTGDAIKRRFLQIQNERRRKRKWYYKSKDSFGRLLDGSLDVKTPGETPQSKVKKSIIIELAKTLIESIQKETSFYSIINKYTPALGEDKLHDILHAFERNGKRFNTENSLAAYLEKCTQSNGRITDTLPELRDGVPGWM